MKRVIGLLLAFGAASCSISMRGTAALASNVSLARSKTSVVKKTTVRASAPQQINYKDLAPADEYFGPLKLSILGIRNTTTDAGKRYAFGIKDADSTMSTASFIDLSVHDWAHKYPHDLDVARALYFLQRLYAMIDAPDAEAKAKTEATWMFSSYGKTPQAKQLRRVLAAAPQPVAPPPAPAPPSFVEPSLEPLPAASARIPVPATTMEAAPMVTSPSDDSRTPNPPATSTPSAALTPLPTAPPPRTTATASPAPATASPTAQTSPSPAAPIPGAYPNAEPVSRTPYPSADTPPPTPFPTPIQPTASDIDGTPAPHH